MRAIVFLGFLGCFLSAIFIHPYIGVLVYSWISFMSPHRLMWNMFPGIPLVLITVLFTLVSWFISTEPKRLPFNMTVCLILLFMMWISVTTMQALNPDIAFDMWSRTIKGFSFILITIALTTNRIRFHSLIWVMVITIGYFGLKGGVFSLLTGGDFLVWGPPETAIADNNDLGAGLTVALPLMCYLWLTSADRRVRACLLFLMAMSCISIIGTYSRAALLGIAVVGIFLWLGSRQKLLSGVVIALAVVMAISFMPEKYFARMHTIQTYEDDSSAMSRLEIWGAALKIAQARPLTGGGCKVTESQAIINEYAPGVQTRAPHNVYVGVLAEQGVPGFLIWIAMLIVGWRNSFWIRRHSAGRPEWQWAGDFARMSQISLAAYCVVGTFGNYAYWDYYFTILGLLAAARAIMQRAAQREQLAPSQAVALSPVVPTTQWR